MERALFVDGEAHILHGVRRCLGEIVEVVGASTCEEALERLREQPDFAFVATDLTLPDGEGIEVLRAALQEVPTAARIVLTGNASLADAMEVVNSVGLFRLLTKPIRPQSLCDVARDALAFHGENAGSRELLESTLSSSINALVEVLALANPLAFGRASKIKEYVQQMARHGGKGEGWEFEMAAMLSQIGCVTIPADTLKRVFAGQPVSEQERAMYAQAPEVSYSILSGIPRLERVARMVAWQRHSAEDLRKEQGLDDHDPIMIGAQMLKLAHDYDRLLSFGKHHEEAIDMLRTRRSVYVASLLDTLADMEVSSDDDTVIRSVCVEDLAIGMTFDEDVTAPNNVVLVGAGQSVTIALIKRLRNFAAGIGVNEPFSVRVPQRMSVEATEFAMSKE